MLAAAHSPLVRLGWLEHFGSKAMKRCPVCTLENEENALACTVCRVELPSGSDETRRCPTCTFENPKLAESCQVCEAQLSQAEQEWKCRACGETVEKLMAAAEEAEANEPFIWLPCAHRACVACHAKWIQAQDEEGEEPTCLTCKASDGSAKPLDDACIRAILGKEAHEERAERLIDRVGVVSCPTPDCTYRVSVEDGVDTRTTTCPRCMRVVVVGAVSLAAMLAQPGELLAAAAAPPLPAALPLPAAAVPLGSGSADDPHCLDESDNDGDGGEGGWVAAGVASAGSAGEATASNGVDGGDGIDGGGGGGDDDDDDDDDDVPLSAAAERHLKRERDEAASADALSGKQYRQCPGCKNGLEKLRGTCNKFQCRCGCRFCWKCGVLADANGNAACRCTGSDHAFWDNVQNRVAVSRKRKR